MASTFYDGAGGARRRSGIDLPVAALAALSAGFVAFAMPADQFAQAILATGLPSVLPAAAPPLGATARALAAAAAATAAFAAVFGLLRLLDRKPAEPARPRFRGDEGFAPESEAGLPRLRRADSHPDAPARRPILAARELGEPDLAAPPAPAAPAAAQRNADIADPAYRFPPPLPEPEPEREPEIHSHHAAEAEAAPRHDPGPAADAHPAEDDSLADLVARLERGLDRRQRSTPPSAEPEPPVSVRPPPAPAAAGRDDRLTSAIENLQRLTSRG